ncbi:phytoene/squalene synthase family protein [Kiloniella antarctica]|uniref:Phytoene/squalene synthase family protein n=1 Tax=Kiloniella antarctica TaxID=1550907 RepID=A0ABW5BRE1_9PROT
MSNNALSPCGQDVKVNDYDRYLTCLFAPEECRNALFALYAFNQEIAKTAEVVSEPLTGMIRLQWWRESVQGIYDNSPRKHIVVEALSDAIHQFSLEQRLFDKIIDSREFDLDEEVPATLTSLEDYVESTSSSLLTAAVEITASNQTNSIHKAVKHMGLAWGILGLVRAIPFHAERKRIYIPRELSNQYNLDPKELFELQSSKALCDITKVLTERLRDHLVHARSFRQDIPKNVMSPLLVGVLADQYISRLEDNDYDPFYPSLSKVTSSSTWRLMWANLRSRY